MKNISLLTLLLFAYTMQLYAQASVEKNVQYIRTKFQQINEAAALVKPDTLELENSTEGSELLVYKKKGTIIKLVDTEFGETGKLIGEYYLDAGGLIFAYIKTYNYNRPIYWDKKKAKEEGDDQWFDEKKTKLVENRYYFKDEKLVRWLGPDKKQVPVSNKKFAAAETEINETIYRLIESIDGEGENPGL